MQLKLMEEKNKLKGLKTLRETLEDGYRGAACGRCFFVIEAADTGGGVGKCVRFRPETGGFHPVHLKKDWCGNFTPNMEYLDKKINDIKIDIQDMEDILRDQATTGPAAAPDAPPLDEKIDRKQECWPDRTSPENNPAENEATESPQTDDSDAPHTGACTDACGEDTPAV